MCGCAIPLKELFVSLAYRLKPSLIFKFHKEVPGKWLLAMLDVLSTTNVGNKVWWDFQSFRCVS